MKKILFSMQSVASPWKKGQPKAHHACVRLAVECTGTEWIGSNDPCPVSKAIFAYLKVNDTYVFNHVCSAVDLAEIPETEDEKWCRKDYVDILLPSFELAEEALSKIKNDVEYLTREINSYREVVGIDTFEVKDEPYYPHRRFHA